MTTTVAPDVDIEELVEQQVPCEGNKYQQCPNEVTWLFVHRCCGAHLLICQTHYDLLMNIHWDWVECNNCGPSSRRKMLEAFFIRIARL